MLRWSRATPSYCGCVGDAVERAAARRCVPRCGGVPPGVFNYVTGPGGSLGRRCRGPGRRGRHVHRQLRRRHAPLPHRGGPLAAAVHRRDGRQERGRRVGAREREGCRHRRAALRVRAVGAEVFGVLARVRRAQSVFNDFVSALHRLAGEDERRRSHRARALDGTGDRRGRACALRGRGGAGTRARCAGRASCTAACASIAATSRTATTALRPSRACRSTIRCGGASSSRRSCWSRRCRTWTRRSHASTTANTA